MATVKEAQARAEAAAPRFHNFIGGQWVDAASGRTFEDIDPATGQVIGLMPRSDASDVDRAARAAREAFASWRLMPAPRRGEILFRAAQLIADRKEDLARLMTREMGKVLLETQGDVQEAIDIGFYMAGEGRRMFGHTVPSEMPDKSAMSVRMPVGVVGVITPWNFPMAIPSWKIFPALIAGNAVVFKPAQYTPILAVKFVELLHEAGVPGGVINLVIGYGSEVGDPLLVHPEVDAITFTGSTEVGRRVNGVGGERLKRVSVELGGKNALVVMDDADLDLAVEALTWAAFGTTGQRCTAASRLVVQRGVARELLDRLIDRARRLRIGNGLDPQVEMGPLVNEAQLRSVGEYVRVGRSEGATLVAGGERATGDGLDGGFFFEPTIFTGVRPEMRIFKEEIFGPVLSVVEVADLDEAIGVVNDSRYGLSSSIFTRDVRTAFRAMRDFYTGIVYVNHSTTGAEVHLPFGGTRDTGNGHREAGQAALDFFTEWKTIYVDWSGRLQRAQIDLPTPRPR